MQNQQAAFWKFFITLHIDLEEFEQLLPDAHFFPVVEDCFETVLLELKLVGKAALLDRRLQIEVSHSNCPRYKTPVWAYFPMYRRRRMAKEVSLEPGTKVLLVFYHPDIVARAEEYILKLLRHQLGHVLLYLQSPKAKNDCPAADEEWKKWIK